MSGSVLRSSMRKRVRVCTACLEQFDTYPLRSRLVYPHFSGTIFGVWRCESPSWITLHTDLEGCSSGCLETFLVYRGVT